MTNHVTTTTKPATLSRTNITAALMLLFTLLSYFGTVPEGFNAPLAVEGLVALGSAAVIYFRTYATQLLRRPTTTQ